MILSTDSEEVCEELIISLRQASKRTMKHSIEMRLEILAFPVELTARPTLSRCSRY